MKYSCMYIDKGITFFYDNIRMCCKSAHNGKGMPYLSEYDNYDINKIFEKKHKYKEMLFNGVIPEECRGCAFIKETDKIHSDDVISFIDIDSFTVCNSRCCYCTVYETDPIDKPVYPILEDLFKKNLIKDDKYGYIQFAGGEPSIMRDFDKIIDLCMENGISNYMIHTNGIKYSKSIEKLLNDFNIKLIISLDAGTKETFFKVKNADCFDAVCRNMKKYAAAQKKSDVSVRSKYIIIPGINDNINELENWYDLSVSSGVKMLILDVEMKWFKAHNQTISPDIQNMIKIIQDKCRKDGIILDYYESLKLWFSREH